MVEIKIYTVGELKSWLDTNYPEQITTDCISQARAVALTKNPSAKPEHPALGVAFFDDKIVGYTAVFPDLMPDGQTWFFGTTGFIDASCRGKGIGTKLYSTMMQACNGRWMATDSSVSALAISYKTGLCVAKYQRFYLILNSNNTLLARLKTKFIRQINKKVLSCVSNDIRIAYMKHVDNSTYMFMQQHAESYVYHRTRAMYNWILQDYFKTEGPESLIHSTKYDFTTTIQQYYIYGIQQYLKDKLVGVAIFRVSNGVLSLLYWFYDNLYTEEVYVALIKHVLMHNIYQFRTFDKKFVEYFNQLGARSLNTKSRVQEVSLSYPKEFNCNPTSQLQGGDGDMFC